MDEERLVRQVAKGDRAAFEELYRRTSPWMVVRLRRRCVDEQIVAEVMQETYLAVWRAAGAFAGTAVGGTATGWLWTIAFTRALIAKAMVPGCTPVGWSGFGGDEYAQTVAAGWVLGDLKPFRGTPARMRREAESETRPVWKKLKALPRSGQLARISAMRAAALSCEGDPFDVLSGGASR
ncbi:RNA polymerase sigma factor [Streptomyces canus]|uniref:RNA polymerase sigma factor n=1 Tax=Streptomyces canus TaxID=58343 RepID=UPI0036E043CF